MDDNNSPKSQMTRYVIYGVGFTIIMLLLAAFVTQLIAVNTVKGKLAASEKKAAALEGELEEKNEVLDAMKTSYDEAIEETDKLRTQLETLKQQYTDIGMKMLVNSVSDNSVSDNSVSDNSVSDNSISENEVSENEVSENAVSGNEEKESEVSGNAASENGDPEDEAAEEQSSDKKISGNNALGDAGESAGSAVSAGQPEPVNADAGSPQASKMSGHSFTDKNGTSTTFTVDEWNYLMNVWAYTGEPEEMIASHTVAELKTVLAAR